MLLAPSEISKMASLLKFCLLWNESLNPCLSAYKVLRKCSTSTLSIKEVLLTQPIGKKIRVTGWVRAIRKQKENVFLDLCDGSCHQKLQVIFKRSEAPSQLSYGGAVDAFGELIASTHPAQNVELWPEEVKFCGHCDVEEFPFPPRKVLLPNYTRKFPYLRSRTKTFGSTLRVRNVAMFVVHEILQEQSFIFINTPIITSNDCEGAGEAFAIEVPKCETPVNANVTGSDTTNTGHFFDKPVFLTVSGQLHLEAMASSLTNVYTLGPTFRAENSRTRHHISEFYMLEAEMAFMDNLEDLMLFIENLIKEIAKRVLDKCPEDVALLHSQAETNVDLNNLLKKQFIRMTYSEAVSILEKVPELEPLKWGQDLLKRHEKHLVKHCDNTPVFVTNFPKLLKPFYMKTCDADPVTVEALDLLVSDIGEICGGSIREHRYAVLKETLEEKNLIDPLTWYLNLRKFGSCPHAGFGLGFERYLQYILGITNIKDTIPFPRWPHHCPL